MIEGLNLVVFSPSENTFSVSFKLEEVIQAPVLFRMCIFLNFNELMSLNCLAAVRHRHSSGR